MLRGVRGGDRRGGGRGGIAGAPRRLQTALIWINFGVALFGDLI
jgi:hypothetical protein